MSNCNHVGPLHAIQYEHLHDGSCRLTSGPHVVHVGVHPVYSMNFDAAMKRMKELLEIPAQ